MKTKTIILLTILIIGGFMTSQPAFAAPRLGRPAPVPTVRSSPVPRPAVTPTPAVDPIAISYETSAASNIALAVTAGQTGTSAGFSIQCVCQFRHAGVFLSA